MKEKVAKKGSAGAGERGRTGGCGRQRGHRWSRRRPAGAREGGTLVASPDSAGKYGKVLSLKIDFAAAESEMPLPLEIKGANRGNPGTMLLAALSSRVRYGQQIGKTAEPVPVQIQVINK